MSTGLASVDNALAAISLVLDRNEIRLVDLASELNVSKSTAHRILSTLCARGFVTQSRSRTYLRGSMLARGEAADQASTRALVSEHLEKLHHEVDKTCSYVVLEGNSIRFVERFVSPDSKNAYGRASVRVGSVVPAHTNSGGRALLAQLTTEELENRYSRGLPRSSFPGMNTVAQLQRVLGGVRRRGYGINTDEAVRGVTAIGRHVRSPRGEILGAVVIAGPSAQMAPSTITSLASLLLQRVAELEARL